MASEQPGRASEGDKTRLCPSCRMDISVLATKCRFCGESVGRPRVEDRQVSIQDLGGRTGTTYVPPTDYMDAIESFRAEEVSRLRAEQRREKKAGFFHRARKHEGESDSDADAASDPALPEVDDPGRPLESLAMPSYRRSPTIRPSNDWLKITLIVLALALVLALLGGIGYYGYARQQARLEALRNLPTLPYENRALTLAERGMLLEALEEARTALAHNDTAENARILDEVRRAIANRVEDLLNADPWQRSHLTAAVNLVNKAVETDRSEVLRRLRDEVLQERDDYYMTLVDADTAQGEVRFELADGQAVVKQRGQTVAGRFVIDEVRMLDGRPEVRVRDTMRRGRDRRPRTVAYSLRDLPRGA